jgi:hypothetical protein
MDFESMFLLGRFQVLGESSDVDGNEYEIPHGGALETFETFVMVPGTLSSDFRSC